MEAYKQEFIEFMVESDVLKFGRLHAEKRPEVPLLHERGRLRDGFAAAPPGPVPHARAIPTDQAAGLGLRRGVRPGVQGHPHWPSSPRCVSGSHPGKAARYCSNRKEVKDHGDTGILLGSALRDGDRVVIVEDVTTSGKSIEERHLHLSPAGERGRWWASWCRSTACERGQRRRDLRARRRRASATGFRTASIAWTWRGHGAPAEPRVPRPRGHRRQGEGRADAYYEQYGAKR